MKRQKFLISPSDWVVFIWLGILGLTVIGYVMNIVDLMNTDLTTITGALIVRVVGLVVFPLGAIAGYF